MTHPLYPFRLTNEFHTFSLKVIRQVKTTNQWMMILGTSRQSQRRRDVTKTQGKHTRLLGSRLRDARRLQRRRSSRTTLLKSLRQAHECSLRSSDRVARTAAPFRAPTRSSRSLTRDLAPPRPRSTPSAVPTRRDAYPYAKTQPRVSR